MGSDRSRRVAGDQKCLNIQIQRALTEYMKCGYKIYHLKLLKIKYIILILYTFSHTFCTYAFCKKKEKDRLEKGEM